MVPASCQELQIRAPVLHVDAVLPSRPRTSADHPPSGHMLARQSYGSTSGLPPLPKAQAASHVPQLSEIVLGRRLQPPNCDHAPTRLEGLIGLVDLEGTGGVQCIAEDFAVGNRPEDDELDAGGRSWTGMREQRGRQTRSGPRTEWRAAACTLLVRAQWGQIPAQRPPRRRH